MVEGYDRFIRVYEATRKLIEEGLEKEESANVMLDSILADAAALRIPVGPKEEELFIDGLKKYFLKLGVIAHESKTRSLILGKLRRVIVFDKEKTFVIVYEMCPGGTFSQRRDWVWMPALSPEAALEKFNETYAYLVKEGICMLYVARVIK